MNDFFNLRGTAVFRVLSLISTVALWLTILLFAIGLMMGFFGEQETKAIGWAMVGFSISSFISCLFMFGFCYLIKIAKSYDKDEQEDNKEIVFQYKGYKGTFTKDDNTGATSSEQAIPTLATAFQRQSWHFKRELTNYWKKRNYKKKEERIIRSSSLFYASKAKNNSMSVLGYTLFRLSINFAQS